LFKKGRSERGGRRMSDTREVIRVVNAWAILGGVLVLYEDEFNHVGRGWGGCEGMDSEMMEGGGRGKVENVEDIHQTDRNV
jgi:hypothetical protein